MALFDVFDVLMQHFYKVIQSNHEKVPSFAMRLDGTLNQIRLQYTGRITDQEVKQHLKDHLFHGVHKHIGDSIRYLYSNPGTTYSQLMIVACKAESKNEEAHDKVRARSAMTTEPVEGTTELGNQIAKLPWPEQDRATAPPVSQIAPDREAIGEDRWTRTSLDAPAPTMV